MRNVFDSNLVTIALLGVLLLLASAVGRVTASNVGGWVARAQGHAQRASAPEPERFDVAALMSFHAR